MGMATARARSPKWFMQAAVATTLAPLDTARRKGHPAMVELLHSRGGVSAKDQRPS